MKISQTTNSLFNLSANKKKAGDWDKVKAVAEMFYKEGYDGVEIDEYDQTLTIAQVGYYKSREDTMYLYKQFKSSV